MVTESVKVKHLVHAFIRYAYKAVVGNLTQINRLVSGQEAMLTTVLPHPPVQECLPLKQTRAHVISGLCSILSSLGVYNSTLKLFQPTENWLYSGIYPRC